MPVMDYSSESKPYVKLHFFEENNTTMSDPAFDPTVMNCPYVTFRDDDGPMTGKQIAVAGTRWFDEWMHDRKITENSTNRKKALKKCFVVQFCNFQESDMLKACAEIADMIGFVVCTEPRFIGRMELSRLQAPGPLMVVCF